MRPMFSVENVGIDDGGSALAVTARLPDWPPTLMPTSSAMAAVKRTAVVVRLFMVSSLRLAQSARKKRKLSRNRGERILAGKDSGNVPDGQIGHCSARLNGAAAKVWHEQDVLEREQLGFNRRLLLEHVQSSACNKSHAQRPGKRLFINDRSTRGVDEICAALQD